MDKLIEELEAAPHGSRKLDARIAEGVIWEPNRAEGLKAARCYDTAKSMCARYTTSLDAQFPWENISMVTAPTKSQPTWTAWHPVERGEGDLRPPVVIAHAATEALARRAVALKARQAMEAA